MLANQMKYLASALAIMFSVTVFAQLGDPAYQLQPPFKNKPVILKSGKWEYRLFYKDKGTIDEGMLGQLIYDNKFVPPVFCPGCIGTPWGTMTSLFAPKSYDRPELVVGWTYTDWDKIPWTRKDPPKWPKRNDWTILPTPQTTNDG